MPPLPRSVIELLIGESSPLFLPIDAHARPQVTTTRRPQTRAFRRCYTPRTMESRAHLCRAWSSTRCATTHARTRPP